ncbi:Uncharacterized protein DAT39_005651, partial [Clarias magur]
VIDVIASKCVQLEVISSASCRDLSSRLQSIYLLLAVRNLNLNDRQTKENKW